MIRNFKNLQTCNCDFTVRIFLLFVTSRITAITIADPHTMNPNSAPSPTLSLRGHRLIHLTFATLGAVAFSGCQAYQTLGKQAKDNYAYVKRSNLELDLLLAERDNLLAERARLKQLSASYGIGSQSSSRSSKSSAEATIQRQVATNEAEIARNARMLAAY